MGFKSSAVGLALFCEFYLVQADLAFVTAQLHTIPEQRSFDGSIEAIHQATISAEARGRIEEITVGIGDSVAAGTIVVTVTGAEQHTGLPQAEANLAQVMPYLVAETPEHEVK